MTNLKFENLKNLKNSIIYNICNIYTNKSFEEKDVRRHGGATAAPRRRLGGASAAPLNILKNWKIERNMKKVKILKVT